MAKRKSDSSSASPRKKTKLDQPSETSSPLTIGTHASSSSSSSSTSQRWEGHERSDTAQVSGPAKADTSTRAKRAKTQRAANSIPKSQDSEVRDWSWTPKTILNPSQKRKLQEMFTPKWEDPDPDRDWVLHEDNPEAFSGYWEPLDLSKRARRWRKHAILSMQGYSSSCSCGKRHYAIGRKSWHYPGQEPELEDPDEPPLPEQDVSFQVQSESVPTYQGRGRNTLLSPELSDTEEDAGNAQPPLAPLDVSASRETSTAPGSSVAVIAQVTPVSTISSPTATATTDARRTSRRQQRTNKRHNVEMPNPRRQARRRNKKEKQGSKGEILQRPSRNRKSKTTPLVEEHVISRSRRASRSNAGSSLWFLDDRGKACLVATLSR